MCAFVTHYIWAMVIFGFWSIVVMVVASNITVKKLMGLTGYFRLSTTFMGVTVVSVATSVPEIAAHFSALIGILSGALDYEISSAIVLGENIGSDIIQLVAYLGFLCFWNDYP